MSITLASEQNRRGPRAVATWLFVVAALILVMIIIGGLTRLTESGLSMVTWKPVTGWLPPLSDADWQALFRQYQQYPEFQKKFPAMTLEGFKGIFWLEYIHRVLGRVIGIVFLLPFLFFLVTRRLPARLALPLGVIFLLGAAQGALGWWMVQSGLVNEPTVSQYRLAAHMSLAVVLYLWVLWVALGVQMPRGAVQVTGGRYGTAVAVLLLAFVTMVSGAFVAGLDAGKIHNTFPLMGGRLFPADYFSARPFFANMFENDVAVQFHHRVLAIVTAAAVVALWLIYRGAGVPTAARRVVTVVLLVAAGQVCLGIYTLLMIVPVALASLHQLGAILLLSSLVWLLHTTRTARIGQRPLADPMQTAHSPLAGEGRSGR